MKHSLLAAAAAAAALTLTACGSGEPSEEQLRSLFEANQRKNASLMGLHLPKTFKKSGCSASGENRYDCAIVATFASGNTYERIMTVSQVGDAFHLENLR